MKALKIHSFIKNIGIFHIKACWSNKASEWVDELIINIKKKDILYLTSRDMVRAVGIKMSSK